MVVTKSSGSELHIGKTSLVTEDVAQLQYHNQGYQVGEITATFKPISRSTISRIVNGHTHKRVRADGRLKSLVPIEMPEQLPHLPDGSPGRAARDRAAVQERATAIARRIKANRRRSQDHA